MPERFCLLFTVVIGAGKIIFTVCIARYKNPKLLKRMQSMKRATGKQRQSEKTETEKMMLLSSVEGISEEISVTTPVMPQQ